jgi:hypothetical protein
VYENPSVIATVDTTTDFVSNTTDRTYTCDGTLTWTAVTYTNRSSSTKFSLGSIQGGTVGYGKVTEKFGANAENGKKVYYYSSAGDINISSAKTFPYPATISLDYERGLLQEEDTYTAGNVLVNKTQNTYQFTNRGSVKTYKAGWKFNVSTSCFFYTYLNEFVTRIFYDDQTNQVKRTSSTQTDYNTATGDSSMVTINYYYDDSLNMQPTRTVTVNSKGDTVLTYIRTPLEKSAINSSITLTTTAAAAIDTLVARNIVGSPLQSEKYVKGILIQKVLTNYKIQPSKLVLPDNVMVQNAANTLEARVQFTKYDSNGNLMEQQKTGDQRHSYIWDISIGSHLCSIRI